MVSVGPGFPFLSRSACGPNDSTVTPFQRPDWMEAAAQASDGVPAFWGSGSPRWRSTLTAEPAAAGRARASTRSGASTRRITGTNLLSDMAPEYRPAGMLSCSTSHGFTRYAHGGLALGVPLD